MRHTRRMGLDGSRIVLRLRDQTRNLRLGVRYVWHRASAGSVPLSSAHELSALDLPGLRRRRVLGMLSLREQAYLKCYARECFMGRGEIVDLGCWLGSSTIPLALGLAANRSAAARARSIHAYDLFRWEAWMDELPCVKGSPLEGRYRPGDSFLAEFRRRVEPWSRRVAAHAADLLDVTWNGGPIEFLFVDAMKSWGLTNSILKTFFPALVPGRSLLVHQDYAHYYTPWIHLVMYRLRRCFRPVYQIAASPSVVFACEEQVPAEMLCADYAFSSFDRDEVDAAFDYSLRLVGETRRPDVMAAKIMAAVHQGDRELAARWLDLARANAYGRRSGLERVRRYVEAMASTHDSHDPLSS